MRESTQEVSFTKTLEKCIKILTLFAEAGNSLTVSEIASHLDLPKSTAYRHIAVLKEYGLVQDSTVEGHYSLGVKILQLARNVSVKSIQETALPFMRELMNQTGESVIMCGLRGDEGVCLEKVDGHHALRVTHERGATFPLHAGSSGKVLLAYLGPEEQDRVIRRGLAVFSDTTITDPRELKKELKKIKLQGYAESDGEVIQGSYGVGAPIFYRGGNAVAALSISGPSHRLASKKEATIRLVTTKAKEITDVLKDHDAQ